MVTTSKVPAPVCLVREVRQEADCERAAEETYEPGLISVFTSGPPSRQATALLRGISCLTPETDF